MSSLDNSNGSKPTEEKMAETTQTSKDTSKRSTGSKPPPKPTSERMAESLHLVRQLADMGIGSTHPHMIAFRAILNQWIREDNYCYNGRVDFDAYGRRGDLVLPRVKGHVASLRLRAI